MRIPPAFWLRRASNGKHFSSSELDLEHGRLWLQLLVAFLLLCVLAACKSAPEESQVSSTEPLPADVVPNQEPSPNTASEVVATLEPVPTPTVTPTPPPLAATVNGEYILLADFERRTALYKSALEGQGVDLESEEGQSELAQVRLDVLESMIDFALIRQEGAAMGVSLSDEELEAEVQADIAAGGGQAAFDQWLEQTGQTAADYRQLLRELLWSQRMLELVTADLPTVAEQVHLRHIAVSSRDTAEVILAELRQGADFAELAQERSEDTITQEEGGDLGWIPVGVIAPELERSAFALEVGEISDVISVGEGYHIIQVVERETDRPVAPELQAELDLAAFEQWLVGLRSTAVVERYVSE